MTNVYQFSMMLSNVDEDTINLEDSLFESGCDDALISYKNGVVYLDFDREGDDFEKAIISAIKDVESSSINAIVNSISPAYLVSLSDIAERVSMTRQAISLLMQGKRGAGSFPAPLLNIKNKSSLWRWSDVATWFYEQGKISDHSIIDFAIIVEDVNSALELRNKNTYIHREQILKQLRA